MFGRLEDGWAPVEITGVNSRRAEREDRRGKPGFWLGRPIVPLEIPLVRKTNATPLHPRCDRKSAEALESKGVVERPLYQKVRKRQKGKRLELGGWRSAWRGEDFEFQFGKS